MHFNGMSPTFSIITNRWDKIVPVNTRLRNLCLNKGFDFINNQNVSLGDLGRDGLHINKDGKMRLALTILNYIMIWRNLES